jgi:two-component system, OmpR family, response regulator TctD
MLVNTLSPRVLLVEDTPELALWVGTALRQAGMTVSFAQDGWRALQLLTPNHGFDVIVLDVQIPGPDGLEVLQQIRQAGDEVPVLILTARAGVPDRVQGLNLGGDDYLTKPFELAELEARLAALLRRQGRQRSGLLALGDLSLDVQGEVRWRSEALALSKRETAALRELLNSANKTLSKERLHRAVFADEDAGLEAVEVLIHRLRKKLEQHTQSRVCITTFRGLGYMLTLSLT